MKQYGTQLGHVADQFRLTRIELPSKAADLIRKAQLDDFQRRQFRAGMQQQCLECIEADQERCERSAADGKITCAKHGGKLELATGKAKALPVVKPVKIYKTEVEDGAVYVSEL